MAVLVTKWFGVFLVNEKSGKIVDRKLMSKDPKECAEKLAIMQRGGILPEERAIVEGKDRVSVSDRRQAELGKPMMYDSSAIAAEDFGFDSTLMHDIMLRLGKLRTSEPMSRDNSLVQAIRELDDLISSTNLLSERLHEWYGMYFPELADYARDEKYSQLVSTIGERDGICEELNLEIESIGADFDPNDMDAVCSLANVICGMYDERRNVEEFVDSIVSVTCPNMCAILGGPLSARMISLAGGLKRLSSLPSSTVQLLGAEKAMFRHLRSGKAPPKHGILYQYPGVHRAPYWQRGKIARALSGKVLIAAKVDAYNGEFCGEELNKTLKARINDIKRRYPDPPKKSAKKSRHQKKGKSCRRP